MMLQRLFLTVLLACLAMPMAALPLAAMPAGGSADVAAASCHGHPEQPAPVPTSAFEKHQCIGCVPLVEATLVASTGPAEVGLPAIGTPPRTLAGTVTSPATPPPKA